MGLRQVIPVITLWTKTFAVAAMLAIIGTTPSSNAKWMVREWAIILQQIQPDNHLAERVASAETQIKDLEQRERVIEDTKIEARLASIEARQAEVLTLLGAIVLGMIAHVVDAWFRNTGKRRTRNGD